MGKKTAPKAAPVESSGWFRRLCGIAFRVAWISAAWISVPLLICGLVVRLSVKDDVDRFAVFYYATPWPVLTAMAAICLVYWWRRPRLRWVTLPVFAFCVTMFIVRCCAFGPINDAPESFRIAYWNVARPVWRLDKILPQADLLHADFAVFGEHRKGTQTPPQWAAHFAGRFVLPLARELLLVAPSEVKRIDGGSLGGVGGCQICRAVVNGREIFLLMVDFSPTLERSRSPAFDRLFQIIDAYSEKPLIVIGDFNTPADSVYFDRLRKRLTSAFDAAGHGYAATWPMPLPVLQLDHIWTNKHLRVLRCEHHTSLYSDHRAVTADITFP
jgi:vancomycin resistance protein VanJ